MNEALIACLLALGQTPQGPSYETIKATSRFPNTALVVAMIAAESTFRQDVVSPKGAQGVMQLLPSTFDWVKEEFREDCYLTGEYYITDVQHNIAVGTCYLQHLYETFGSVKLAVMAYHAGPRNVHKKAIGGQTILYLERVKANYSLCTGGKKLYEQRQYD